MGLNLAYVADASLGTEGCAKNQDFIAKPFGRTGSPEMNPTAQGKGLASTLTLSIPGVPVAAQKPILTRVPAGTMSALTE